MQGGVGSVGAGGRGVEVSVAGTRTGSQGWGVSSGSPDDPPSRFGGFLPPPVDRPGRRQWLELWG